MVNLDESRINAFTAAGNITAARAIRVFFVLEERNEWENWQGDTGKIQRVARFVGCNAEQAEMWAERARKPGSTFIIQESVALALDCDTGILVISESADKIPLRKLKSDLKVVLGQPRLLQWRRVLITLQSRKFVRVDFFKKAEKPFFLTFHEGDVFYERHSSSGGKRHHLAWSLRPTLVESGPVVILAAEIHKSMTARATTRMVQSEERPLTLTSSAITVMNPLVGAEESTPASNANDANGVFAGAVTVASKDTTREQLVLARIGQGVYRSRLELIELRCRLTGLAIKTHLRASHIKPWSDSNDIERLDGHNGLLLSPHIDHLFDQGYISFSDEGDILVSPSLDPAVLRAWQINITANVGNFSSAQRRYLAHHRSVIFRN